MYLPYENYVCLNLRPVTNRQSVACMSLYIYICELDKYIYSYINISAAKPYQHPMICTIVAEINV